MKNIVSLIIIIASIIIFAITTTSCSSKKISHTKFQIPTNVDIDISSTHLTGILKKQTDIDLLLNFINSLELVEKNLKPSNESADVYVKIYNNTTLINDIRFYGGGIVYDYLTNITYIIDEEKQFELFELLEQMCQ